MLKNIVLLITAFICAQVFAEPMKMASKSELASAKKAAEGLLSSSVSADQVFEYAEEAKKSAEKYQLYCTAFKLYAKEEKAEEAAKVISTIQTEFIGTPDKDIVSMIEQYAKKLAKDNEELGAALSVSKMRASASSQLSKAKKDLKKNPNSVEHKYLIAESHAVLGDWKVALKQFKDAGGTVWQVASEELSGDVSAKIAAFWWDYKPRSKFNAEPAFKAHSAALYEKLLKDGELSILEKATAESRIEKAGRLGATKPKSEFDKLNKICDTKGLVHRWSFNGNLKDSVGDADARIIGNGAINDKACNVNLGGIDLCDVAHEFKPDTPFTIEAWYTRNGDTFGSRMILLSRPDKHEVGMTSGGRNEHWFHLNGYAKSWKESEVHINCGVPTYMAICYDPGSSNASWRIYIASNNGEVAEKIFEDAQKIGPICYFALGAPCTYPSMSRFSYANAVYDECRIWKKALTKEEVKKSYKAGPDRIVNR